MFLHFLAIRFNPRNKVFKKNGIINQLHMKNKESTVIPDTNTIYVFEADKPLVTKQPSGYIPTMKYYF